MHLSRRSILKAGCAAGIAGLLPTRSIAADTPPAWADQVRRIKDAEIRAGVESAISKNLMALATQRQYPGHFTINADGSFYGNDSTWPGLDSWQMTGAYLILGQRQLVLDYFEFVRASQRKDGTVLPASADKYCEYAAVLVRVVLASREIFCE